jgi:hypothetical protein
VSSETNKTIEDLFKDFIKTVQISIDKHQYAAARVEVIRRLLGLEQDVPDEELRALMAEAGLMEPLNEESQEEPITWLLSPGELDPSR